MTSVGPGGGAFLRAVYNLAEDGVPARRARIRDRVGLAGPTVTQTVARLIAHGFLEPRDQLVELTENGRREAMHLVRRHRLAEKLLAEVVGLPLPIAHREASAWEHTIGEETERAIIDLVDDPTVSVWGNPVPLLDELGRDVSQDHVEAGHTLLELKAGSTIDATVLSVSEQGQDDLAFATGLVDAGVLPGAEVTATADESGVTLRAGDSVAETPHLPWKQAHLIKLTR